jgi:serine/threonine protein kinase
MKTCPHCTNGFHDSQTTCPIHGVLLNEIRDLKPGMVIRNSYKIVRKLGQGGMGSVYLAQHLLLDEPRALKFLSPELANDPSFTNRFLREVRTLHQLRNKNVVDCGDPEQAEDDSLFFPMEFVDGPDLRDFLDKHPRPFEVKLALDITRGIAEGLGAAHAKGMVHRDIKPENILMAWEGDAWVPKIADFGIVATKESSLTHTRTGASLLTVAYAAPEQWRGMRASELDGRTDIYALGGVLYEMLTGQTAFDAESYEGWMYQHLTATPKPPSEVNHELAKYQGADEIVLWMMRREREERPVDVASVLAALDSITEEKKYTHSCNRQDSSAPIRTKLDEVIYEQSTIKSVKDKDTESIAEKTGAIIIKYKNPSLKGESITVHLDKRELVISRFPMKFHCSPGYHNIRVNGVRTQVFVRVQEQVSLVYEKGIWRSKLYIEE